MPFGTCRTALDLTDSRNGHNATHELFHNFVHNHSNNSQSNSTMYRTYINSMKGHTDAGGIFERRNDLLGTKLHNLNQKNVNDALLTLPTLMNK